MYQDIILSKSVSPSKLNPSWSVPSDCIFLPESWQRASMFVNIDGMELLEEGGISADLELVCEVGDTGWDAADWLDG